MMTKKSRTSPDMQAGGFEGIVILGAPRSGTTLLRRILDNHPNIACPGETGLLTAAARFLQTERIAEGVETGVLSGLAYAGFSETETLSRLREFVFGFHREVARKAGKARWAEKSAFDAFHIPAIERLCGEDIMFVCLQRHGLDVVCSIDELCQKKQSFAPELHDYIRRCPHPLEAFARAWVDAARAVHEFAQRHPQNAISLSYEDLVADPERELERLFTGLGEPWEPSVLERALANRANVGLGDWKTYARSTIDAASVGRWRKLSRSTQARLAEIANPTLELLGYGRVDAPPQEDAATARRRYELGLLIKPMQSDASNE